MERHLLPLLREHRIRPVQVARAGASQHEGIRVLDDSRAPGQVHLEGAFRLQDELRLAGTVPQVSGARLCSVKAKGWPIDTFLAADTGGRPYLHVLGFEAGESARATRDARFNTAVRTGWYPLIDWGWQRADCARYIRACLGVEWIKTLSEATVALVQPAGGRPEPGEIRTSLMGWGFNSCRRNSAPEQVQSTLAWLEENTAPVGNLAETQLIRQVLEAVTAGEDGLPLAAATQRLRRSLLSTTLKYAVEQGLLDRNPIKAIRWVSPKAQGAVDPRRVVNPGQARRLLASVGRQGETGRRLVAFFGAMYYAGLRPEEVVNLNLADITLPAPEESGRAGWGELHISRAAPFVGAAWTDTGRPREDRGLKHRARGEGRSVPCPPQLVALLREHIAGGIEPSGRIFSGPGGGELPQSTYQHIWDKARKQALTPEQYASQLGKRPYDLRHACLSTWLNGGVPATQVAERAGHTVEILLRIYAKVVYGQDQAARRRIEMPCAQTRTIMRVEGPRNLAAYWPRPAVEGRFRPVTAGHPRCNWMIMLA